MARITIKQLEAKIKYLNQLTNSPEAPYLRSDGRNVAQVGNYYLSQAYGGVCVNRICNEQGGVTTPLFPSHIPKREAYNLICAYIFGIEDGIKANV